MADVYSLRQSLLTDPNCRFVTPDEFTRMMLSRVSFSRLDEPDANLFGLVNDRTGQRVFVKAEELDKTRKLVAQLN